jgi:uncharacterized membrane protein YgdD (TMEM256/DUF423 family)
MIMKKVALLSGAVFGFLGVALGAFGAHALKPLLSQSGRMDTFELAVRYQFYHALALLAIGILLTIDPTVKYKYATICFILGVILFSGSLYIFSLSELGMVAMLTPIGGFLLILGWSFMIVGLVKK